MTVNNRLAVWMHCLGNPIWIDEDSWSEWRSDNLGAPEPNQAQLDAAVAAYEDALDYGAVTLSSDKSTIVGNGSDAATVTVTYRLPFPDFVTLRIAGKEAVVPFFPKGIGAPFTRTNTIDDVTSVYPGEEIVIEVIGWGCPDVPGGDMLVIEVT